MSWFSRIISGIGAGVNWLSRNSGTIAAAAKAVATVAGVIPLTTADFENDEIDEAEAQDYLAVLQPNFKSADRYLLEAAEKKYKESEFELGAGNATQESNITGIWTSPTTTAGEPPIGMYQDLNRFLYQEGMPTYIPTTDSQHTLGFGFVDVALNIGSQIFGSLFHPSENAVAADTSGVKTQDFLVDYSDQGVRISGVHAWYSIPMGHLGNQKAWHAALYIRTTTTPEFREKQAQLRRQMHFSSISPSLLASAGPEPQKSSRWNVTLLVPWTTFEAGNSARQLVAAYIKTNYPDHSITFNQLQGLSQVIKIEADIVQYNPYFIGNAVTQAVGYAVDVQQNPLSLKSNADKPVPIIANGLQIPEVQITSTSIVVPSVPTISTIS